MSLLIKNIRTSGVPIALASLLSACISGGDDSGNTSSPVNLLNGIVDTVAQSEITIAGVALKGVIAGGIVTVHPLINGEVDTSIVLGRGRTDENGQYQNIKLEGHNGEPVVVRVTAAADGTTTMLCDLSDGCGDGINFGDKLELDDPDFALSAMVADPSNGVERVNISMLTDLAASTALDKIAKEGREAKGAIKDANASVANRFGITTDDLTRLPLIDLTDPDALDGQDEDAITYNLYNAGIADAMFKDGEKKSIVSAIKAFNKQFVNDGGLADTESNDTAKVTHEEILDSAAKIIEIIDKTGKGDKLAKLNQIKSKIKTRQLHLKDGDHQPTQGEVDEDIGVDGVSSAKAMVQDLRDLAYGIDLTNAENFTDKLSMAEDAIDEDAGAALMAVAKAVEAMAVASDMHAEDPNMTMFTHDETGIDVYIEGRGNKFAYRVDSMVVLDDGSQVKVELEAENTAVAMDDQADGEAIQPMPPMDMDGEYPEDGEPMPPMDMDGEYPEDGEPMPPMDMDGEYPEDGEPMPPMDMDGEYPEDGEPMPPMDMDGEYPEDGEPMPPMDMDGEYPEDGEPMPPMGMNGEHPEDGEPMPPMFAPETSDSMSMSENGMDYDFMEPVDHEADMPGDYDVNFHIKGHAVIDGVVELELAEGALYAKLSSPNMREDYETAIPQNEPLHADDMMEYYDTQDDMPEYEEYEGEKELSELKLYINVAIKHLSTVDPAHFKGYLDLELHAAHSTQQHEEMMGITLNNNPDALEGFLPYWAENVAIDELSLRLSGEFAVADQSLKASFGMIATAEQYNTMCVDYHEVAMMPVMSETDAMPYDCSESRGESNVDLHVNMMFDLDITGVADDVYISLSANQSASSGAMAELELKHGAKLFKVEYYEGSEGLMLKNQQGLELHLTKVENDKGELVNEGYIASGDKVLAKIDEDPGFMIVRYEDSEGEFEAF